MCIYMCMCIRSPPMVLPSHHQTGKISMYASLALTMVIPEAEELAVEDFLVSASRPTSVSPGNRLKAACICCATMVVQDRGSQISATGVCGFSAPSSRIRGCQCALGECTRPTGWLQMSGGPWENSIRPSGDIFGGEPTCSQMHGETDQSGRKHGFGAAPTVPPTCSGWLFQTSEH